MKNIALATIVVCIGILGGCASSGNLSGNAKSGAGEYPNNWEQMVKSYVKDNFVDPYSIRDSVAAAPYRNSKLFYDSWTVCVRMNAKNRMGGYSGPRYFAFKFRNGVIDGVGTDDDGKFDCVSNSRAKNIKFAPINFNY